MAHPGRIKRLAGRLDAAVLVFIAACFVLPTGPAYALVFYILVLPCIFARLATGQVPRNPAFWGGAALIIWSGMTLAWGRDDGGRSFSMAIAAVCTLAFWFAAATGLTDESMRERLGRLVVWLGTANAAAAVLRYFVWPTYVIAGQPKRLHGWGVTSHPVLGAAVFSVCCLSAMDLAIRDRKRRVAYLAAAGAIGVAIALTKSRGPELALAGGVLALLAAGPLRRLAPAMLAVAPAGWLLWRMGLIRAGDSGHLLIWRATLAQIAARPWAGYGLAADMPASIGADKRFPHDLYLSLLFYSGVIGLLLFAAWAGALIWRVLRLRQEPHAPWVLALWANALIAGLTDFGQITKGPGPLWIILWLPAALSAAIATRRHVSPP